MITLLDAESHWSEVIEQNHFPDGTLHINMPPNYTVIIKRALRLSLFFIKYII